MENEWLEWKRCFVFYDHDQFDRNQGPVPISHLVYLLNYSTKHLVFIMLLTMRACCRQIDDCSLTLQHALTFTI